MFTYLYAIMLYREFITLLTVLFLSMKNPANKKPTGMLYIKYDSLPVNTQPLTGSPQTLRDQFVNNQKHICRRTKSIIVPECVELVLQRVISPGTRSIRKTSKPPHSLWMEVCCSQRSGNITQHSV